MDGGMDQQDYKIVITITSLGGHHSKVQGLNLTLVILLGCFTICLVFLDPLTLILTFSPPQPRHIVLFVCSSHGMAFQNCLNLDFPEVERLLLKPETSLNMPGSTHMRLRTRGSSCAASGVLRILEVIQPLLELNNLW